MKKVCVIGSINMDLVTTVQNFPNPGETVSGRSFNAFPGGKGGNQAIAIGRLGGDVHMVGKVGDDIYGANYIENFKNNNVKYESIGTEKNISTGIAVIQVNSKSENNIVVVSGANGAVNDEFIEQQWDILRESDIFLFQLEIPINTVISTMKKLKDLGKIIILDPAPAADIPDHIYKYIDFITPNETELKQLTGKSIENEEDLRGAAYFLLEKGVTTVIAKSGKKGAYILNSSIYKHIKGFNVNAIDTTAAGDSFNGGFAYALANGMNLEESVIFANAVGAISTTALGTQDAMPSLDEVKEFLYKNDCDIMLS